MSEIQIIVPLSALPEETPMTAEGILRTIGDAQTNREAAQHYRTRMNSCIALLNAFAGSLNSILDEVDDEYAKAKALRGLVQETREAANSYRGEL